MSNNIYFKETLSSLFFCKSQKNHKLCIKMQFYFYFPIEQKLLISGEYFRCQQKSRSFSCILYIFWIKIQYNFQSIVKV